MESKKEDRTKPEEGLSSLDESVLFFTGPYAKVAIVCWVLSLFCLITLRHDTKSTAFILSLLTILIDTLFLTVLYVKAKRVRKTKKRISPNHTTKRQERSIEETHDPKAKSH